MPLPINFNAVLSELLAQFLFVFICAAAASAPIASIAARAAARARAAGGRCPRPRPGPRARAAPRRAPGARAWRPHRTRRAHAGKPPFWKAVHHHAHNAGTGCATGVAGTPGWVQQVSLTFGLTITVLAYTIGGRSAATSMAP